MNGNSSRVGEPVDAAAEEPVELSIVTSDGDGVPETARAAPASARETIRLGDDGDDWAMDAVPVAEALGRADREDGGRDVVITDRGLHLIDRRSPLAATTSCPTPSISMATLMVTSTAMIRAPFSSMTTELATPSASGTQPRQGLSPVSASAVSGSTGLRIGSASSGWRSSVSALSLSSVS